MPSKLIWSLGFYYIIFNWNCKPFEAYKYNIPILHYIISLYRNRQCRTVFWQHWWVNKMVRFTKKCDYNKEQLYQTDGVDSYIFLIEFPRTESGIYSVVYLKDTLILTNYYLYYFSHKIYNYINKSQNNFPTKI